MKQEYSTLVLNKLYVPIHIIDWKKAISLLYQDLAQSLDRDLIPYTYSTWLEYCNLPSFDESYYNYIHSVSLRIAVPDILVLRAYDKLPRTDVKFTREGVFHRDKNICGYCGKKFKRDELTIDHIIPKSRGGNNSWRNTITACKKCNNRKDNRTPQEAGMVLLHKPTEPRWTDKLHTAAQHPNIRSTWLKFLEAIGA